MLAADTFLKSGFILLCGLCLNARQINRPLVDKTDTNGMERDVSLQELYKPLPYKLPSSGLINESGSTRILFSAEVKRGKLNGAWTSWYANGVICDSGRLVNNLPDGKWEYRNQKGEILAVRHYNADKFVRITGEMLHYHPKRSFYYLAALYQRNRAAALQYLDARYSFPDSRTGNPATTLRQLVDENISKEGGYRPVFVQQLHDGLYLNYFPGGLVKDSGFYKDGLRTGKWIHRDSAAAGWYQGAYLHDIRIKEWKHYDGQGRLLELIHYRSGKEVWRKKIKRG